MKTFENFKFDPATAKINYNGHIAECKYVSFEKIISETNANGTLGVFAEFQNPLTGEVCCQHCEYPDFIKYLFDSNTLRMRHNATTGELMLWHETIYQSCGLTKGDLILQIHIDGEMFDKILIYTEEAFRAYVINEEEI